MFRRDRRRVIVRSTLLVGGLLARNFTFTAAMASSSGSTSSSAQQQSPQHAGASPHWEALWADGLSKGTRFDVAGVSLPLAAELSTRNHATRSGMSALIPGSGRAYDAIALSEHGFASVTAVDLSPTACVAAREEIAAAQTSTATSVASKTSCDVDNESGINVICCDFFDLEGQYDFIWDNTFLCALDPSTRERWALKMKALLKPGGELITCVFPIGDREGGPPFALSVPLVKSLLEPVGFQSTMVQDQLPLEQQHRRPGDPLESVLTRGSALVTWKI